MRTKPLLGAILAAVPVFAPAQDGLPPAFQNLPMDNMMLDNMQRNMGIGAYAKGGPSKGGSMKVHQTRPVAKGATTFHPNPAVTRQTVARYVAWANTHSPKGAAELARAYAKEPPARMWQALVEKDHLRADDLADAYGEYWATVWTLATGQSKTPAQTRGVIEQFRPMLASPRRPFGEGDRQAMAEGIMLDQIQTTFWVAGAAKKGDQAGLAQASEAAAQRFRKNFGLDPKTLRLTPQGFARA